MSSLQDRARSLIARNPALAGEVARILSADAETPRQAVGLTRLQSDVLSFLVAFRKAHGYSPSFSEICDQTGIASKSSVHRVVEALEDRGYVRRMDGKARSVIPVVA